MAEAKKQEESKEEAVVETVEKKPETAKAGKRSAKAQKEVEEKEAKEAKKTTKAVGKDDEKPKQTAKPTRSKLERRGKKYQEAAKSIDKSKEYSLKEAVDLSKKTATTKFDSTVELHMRLNVDPKQADQNIRGTVVLPAGSGKTARVAVFAEADDAKKAKAAGADIAESDEFLQRLEKEQLDFDVLIAAPKMMAKLGKYARILGPKGLMPNPKSGTVTADVVKAVKDAKGGKIEYRVDSTGIVHLGIGKASFSEKDLLSNLEAVLGAIKGAKPSSVKSGYVQSVYLTTSMGPSVKIAISEL
jgi:large subunit ribosomal protein L1